MKKPEIIAEGLLDVIVFSDMPTPGAPLYPWPVSDTLDH
jgi:hypothetical protein